MRRLHAQLAFQAADESVKKVKEHAGAVLEQPAELGVNKGAENDRADALGVRIHVDLHDSLARFAEIINKRQCNLVEFEWIELGQEALAQGFGRDSRAVGYEKNRSSFYCWFRHQSRPPDVLLTLCIRLVTKIQAYYSPF